MWLQHRFIACFGKLHPRLSVRDGGLAVKVLRLWRAEGRATDQIELASTARKAGRFDIEAVGASLAHSAQPDHVIAPSYRLRPTAPFLLSLALVALTVALVLRTPTATNEMPYAVADISDVRPVARPATIQPLLPFPNNTVRPVARPMDRRTVEVTRSPVQPLGLEAPTAYAALKARTPRTQTLFAEYAKNRPLLVTTTVALADGTLRATQPQRNTRAIAEAPKAPERDAPYVSIEDVVTVAAVLPSEPVLTVHTVAPGESLSKIALLYYGNGNRYDQIMAANTDTLRARTGLVAGQRLIIPDVVVATN